MKLARPFAMTAVMIVTLVIATAEAKAAGLEVMLEPGYGSAGSKSPVLYEPTGLAHMEPGSVSAIWNGSAKPYGAGVVLAGSVGYRVLPFLSFGLTGGWRQSGVKSAEVQAPLSNASRSGLNVGFYVRGYLPLVGALTGFDPWASLGATYVYDKQNFDQAMTINGLGNITMPISLTHHGVGIPLALGIDYRVLPFLAVGPAFRYQPVVAVAGCMDTHPTQANLIGAGYCSTDDSRKRITAAESYAVWSLQLELRLAL